MSNAGEGEDDAGASNQRPSFSFSNLIGNIIQLAGTRPNPDVIVDFMSTMMPEYNFTVTARNQNSNETHETTTETTSASDAQETSKIASSQNCNERTTQSTMGETTSASHDMMQARDNAVKSLLLLSQKTSHKKDDDTLSDPISQATEEVVLDDDEDTSNLDDTSFHTANCDEDSNTNNPLFDMPEIYRFPQGKMCYSVDMPSFNTSWKSVQYSHMVQKTNEKVRFFSCLGVYKCPEHDCQFVLNPVQPRGKDRKKWCAPEKPEGNNFNCVVHKTKVVHMPCKALHKLVTVHGNSSTTVHHSGKHNHPRPHEDKPSKAAMEKLTEIINMNAEATPRQLAHGTPTRPPARKIHPSLGNTGRLAASMKKIMNKNEQTNPKITIKTAYKWEKEMGISFVKDMTPPAVIIIQLDSMAEVAKTNELYAFQTDTIEGWTQDDDYPNMCVTITSTHSDVLGRHVPVLMSITYGKTAADYKAHFKQLLLSLEYDSFYSADSKKHEEQHKPGNANPETEEEDPWALLNLHKPSEDEVSPLCIGVTTRLPPELDKGNCSHVSKTGEMRGDDDDLVDSDQSLQHVTKRNLQVLKKGGLIYGGEFAHIAKAHARHRDTISREQDSLSSLEDDSDSVYVYHSSNDEETLSEEVSSANISTSYEDSEEDASSAANDEHTLGKAMTLTKPILNKKNDLTKLRKQLLALTMPILKNKLKEKNLKVGGRKNELVNRLVEHAELESRLPDIRDYTAARMMVDSNSFASSFPGNISDFSEAERLGFEQAAREVFSLSEVDNIDFEYFYKCCSVHFKRSVARVKNNHRIVMLQLADTFQHYVNILLNKDTSKEVFDNTVISMRRDFPDVKNWIDWYLDPNRGKLIFPALASGNIAGHGSDTNAQEGAGRWIKDAHPKQSKPSADECLQAMFTVALEIHQDLSDEKLGIRTRYGEKSDPIEREEKRAKKGKKTPKTYSKNDGKPPEKTSELIKKVVSARSSGRPKGATSKAPLGESIVDVSKAIKWGFEVFHEPSSKYITATNTCPLDTVMMALFLLRKYDEDLYFPINKNEDLRNILDLVQKEMGAHARVHWVHHVLTSDPSSSILSTRNVSLDDASETWDMSGNILSQMGSICDHLFKFQVTDNYSLCEPNNFQCPFFNDLDASDDQSSGPVENAEVIHLKSSQLDKDSEQNSMTVPHQEEEYSIHTFLISGEGRFGMNFSLKPETGKVKVGMVYPDSVAMLHGIQVGDEILPLAPLNTENTDVYRPFLDACYTQSVRFQVKRLWKSCITYVVHERKALHRFTLMHTKGKLGVTLATSDDQSFMWISSVEANSLAAIHGLQVDDIICAPFTNGSEAGDSRYCDALLRENVGRPLVIEVLRDVDSIGLQMVNTVDINDLKVAVAPHDPFDDVKESKVQQNPFVFSIPKSFMESRNSQSKEHIGVPTEGVPRNTHTMKSLSVSPEYMGNIQAYVDIFYNRDGPGEEVDCDGRGTDLPRDYVTGKLICEKFCKGTRYVTKSLNIDPTLLHIEAEGGAFMTYHTSQTQENASLPNMNSIEKSLVINGTRYVLVQANLYNGVHFRGVTVLLGKFLMFDGMWNGRRLRFIGGDTLFEKYSVTSLWYKSDGLQSQLEKRDIEDGVDTIEGGVGNQSLGEKRDIPDLEVEDNENTKTGDGVVEIESDCDESLDMNHDKDGDKGESCADANESTVKTKPMKRKSNRKRRKPKRADDTPEQKEKKARTKSPRRRPMGVTIDKVHGRGTIPKCRYCQRVMERGLWHMIKTSVSSENKHWKNYWHYHFECSVKNLTHEESIQLVTIMRNSDDVSEEITKKVENEEEKREKKTK